MFETLGRFSYRRRRLVLALTGSSSPLGLAWGTGVFGSLANGGFDAPDTEAANAVATIEQTIGRTGTDVIVLYAVGRRPWPIPPSGRPWRLTWPGCRRPM